MKTAVRAIGILFLALAAGCAGVREGSTGVMGQTGPLMVDPSLVGSSQGRPAAAESPLDVAGLKSRLQDTRVIGEFTKLALKNHVDDLLNQFRAYYQSGQSTAIAPLQQPYDMLVLKVLCVIQDSDPALARTIWGSREAIWDILADPDKFHSAT